MSNQILFCNIGWMERYKGITDTDKIIGGGRYVKDNSEGGEIYNFLNRNGYCYGYVQPVNSSRNITGGTINIEKLGAPKGANSISNVDVIMTATSPTEGGTYVIRWYKNATIYRDKQYFDISQGSFGLDTQGNQYGYRFYAPYTEATLLPRDQRTLKIPRATGKSPVKGGMGQSNVWYAQDLKDEDFFKKVRDLIGSDRSKFSRKNIHSKPNIEKNKLVETVAIALTTAHYESYGYVVDSKEKDNRGWDLEASTENIILKIEVKGLSGKIVNIELTPNEYKAFIAVENQFLYRLSVVTECLTESPKLHIFSYNIPSSSWINEDGQRLKVIEKHAATISLA